MLSLGSFHKDVIVELWRHAKFDCGSEPFSNAAGVNVYLYLSYCGKRRIRSDSPVLHVPLIWHRIRACKVNRSLKRPSKGTPPSQWRLEDITYFRSQNQKEKALQTMTYTLPQSSLRCITGSGSEELFKFKSTTYDSITWIRKLHCVGRYEMFKIGMFRCIYDIFVA